MRGERRSGAHVLLGEGRRGVVSVGREWWTGGACPTPTPRWTLTRRLGGSSGRGFVPARGVAPALLPPEPLLDVRELLRGTVGVVPYIWSSPPRLVGRARVTLRAMSSSPRCSRIEVRSVGEPRRESPARTGSSGKKAEDSLSLCTASASSADE